MERKASLSCWRTIPQAFITPYSSMPRHNAPLHSICATNSPRSNPSAVLPDVTIATNSGSVMPTASVLPSGSTLCLHTDPTHSSTVVSAFPEPDATTSCEKCCGASVESAANRLRFCSTPSPLTSSILKLHTQRETETPVR